MVPYLVRFIDSLTNVYVRYNRKRLKGRNGLEDSELALSALYDVLLTVCKVMAPFTPFFTGELLCLCGPPLPAVPRMYSGKAAGRSAAAQPVPQGC